MKKFSLSFLLIFLVLGMFATAVMANANNTGEGETFDELIKSLDMYDNDAAGPQDQKTHGSYQNNTNSCASCHQTHAGSAADMLFTESSQTCMACHDGTLGFYDVEATGAEYLNSSNTAGTFGGDAHFNSSMHNVFDGNINHNAAPGGKAGDTNASSWGATFTCASCHAPHGSYSDRLLHYNPNNMANTPVAEGGKKQVNIPIVAGAGTGYHIRINGNEMELYNGNTKVTTPWLSSGFAFRTNGQVTGNSNTLLTVDFRGAIATVNDPANTASFIGGTADIPVTYSVTLAKDATYVSEISNVDWKHDVVATMSNSTNLGNYSDFCASCHTDYVKGHNGTSTFDATKDLHGHTARNSSTGGRSCAGCHFAHGNDVDIMLDASGRTVQELVEDKQWSLETARNYMVDKNASSALKKYTNMSVCFACHNHSKNTVIVNQTPSAEQPHEWSNTNDPSTKK